MKHNEMIKGTEKPLFISFFDIKKPSDEVHRKVMML